jgi:hypothetical protein
MWMIGLLVPLLCLIGLVGYIWLCVVAFKRHPGWGLLVLFLSPITAVVFALKHWQESKKPFLVYMGSFVGCVALAVYLFSTVGLQMMALAEQASAEASTAMTDQQPGAEAGSAEAEAPAPAPSEGTGALDPEEEAEMRQAAETMREMNTAEATDEPQPAETEPGAAKSDTLAGADLASDLPPAGNLSDMVPPGFHLVPVGKAGDYIGKKIRIVGKDGKEIEGRLTDASPHGLSVERTLSSGTITFDLAANEVKTLLVAYQ